MKKKILSLALISVMTFMTACGGGGGDTEGSKEGTNNTTQTETTTGDKDKDKDDDKDKNKDDENDKDDKKEDDKDKKSSSSGELEKISMTLMGGPKTVNSWMQEQLEEKYGIEFDFIMLPGWSDAASKITLLMSDASQRPDVIWWWGLENDYAQWIENDLLVDLAPFFENGGDNIKAYYDTAAMYPAIDESGAIYRIPGDVAEYCSTTLLMRKDWLDNLDLEVPTTLEEYREVMRAFTFDDPDGDGKPNTYGFVNTDIHSPSVKWRIFWPFMSAFGAYPEHYVLQDDGTVKWGPVLPEMKEALEYIKDVYDEGLMDPQILSSTDFGDIYPQGYWGSTYRWATYLNPENSDAKALMAANPEAEIISVDLPVGPKGKATELSEDGTGWCYFGITNACEDPEAVFEVMNDLLSPETFKFIQWGIEGEHYEINDKGEMDRLISPEEDSALGISLITEFMNYKDENNLANVKEVADLFKHLEETSAPMREEVVFFTELRPVNNKYAAELEKLRDEYFFQIISGERPLDDFDEFVEEYYKFGGEEVEKEANEVYKKQIEEKEKAKELWTSLGGKE